MQVCPAIGSNSLANWLRKPDFERVNHYLAFGLEQSFWDGLLCSSLCFPFSSTVFMLLTCSTCFLSWFYSDICLILSDFTWFYLILYRYFISTNSWTLTIGMVGWANSGLRRLTSTNQAFPLQVQLTLKASNSASFSIWLYRFHWVFRTSFFSALRAAQWPYSATKVLYISCTDTKFQNIFEN
mgnify:CR=1 FL=1